MQIRCRGGQAVACAAAALLFSAPAWGTLVSYTVDPAQSVLSLSGNWNGMNLQQKPVGSLSTSYSGSIQADLTDTSIQLLSADLNAEAGRKIAPRANGQPGRDFADHGGFFQFGPCWLGMGLQTALRDVALDLTSSPMALSDGAFDAASVGVAATSGSMDYAGTSFLYWFVGGGRVALPGDPVANGGAVGSLASSESSQTLTIPIEATFAVKLNSPLPDDLEWVNLTLSGSIVATRADLDLENNPLPDEPGRPSPEIPEPATLALLMLGFISLAWKRR